MSRKHRIENGAKFRLSKVDPDDTGEFESKEDAETVFEADILRLRELHERFFVDNTRSLLIVLQAIDTGGKDGTIKKIFSGINPVGCQVTSFKAPSTEERDHDFLWRISKALPARGNFGIFNRSHYEDVLVVRVHDLVPEKVWSRRYDQINDFERLLHLENTVIVKFFLYIGKDEQKRRLQARLDDPEKTWKFDARDLEERKYWDDYIEAYEEAIRRCSTPWAPWYVVPANKKWYRNYVVANALVDVLSNLKMTLPKPDFDPSKIKIK